MQVIRDVLLLGHRQAFAWVDEWIGTSAGFFFSTLSNFGVRVGSERLGGDPPVDGQLGFTPVCVAEIDKTHHFVGKICFHTDDRF